MRSLCIPYPTFPHPALRLTGKQGGAHACAASEGAPAASEALSEAKTSAPRRATSRFAACSSSSGSSARRSGSAAARAAHSARSLQWGGRRVGSTGVALLQQRRRAVRPPVHKARNKAGHLQV